MKLKKVDIIEFKNDIYDEYKTIFPFSQRKPYILIKRVTGKGITDILKIIVEDTYVGFFIINHIDNNNYIHLDYFAILPQYQDKGYGTEAIKLLQEMYKDYNGIFIEIEKLKNGKNEEENHIRERRAKFYEKAGFKKLGFDIDLYKVIYSAYMLPCKTNDFSDEEVMEKVRNIYIAISGKRSIDKNCRFILGD